jgi:DNA-binding transcriptional ArsR family regulator
VSVDPPIPADPGHLLAALREPRRLRILLALERRPRSAVDLQRDLGLTYTEVSWALKQLERAGLVSLRINPSPPPRRGRGADIIKIYGTRHTGWSQLLAVLQTIAGTSPDSS